METAFTIIGLAISALAVLMGLLVRQLNKRDQRMEQLMKGEKTEKRYMRATGSLAFYTARAVHNKTMPDGTKLCNGEVADAIKYYKSCEHDLEDYQQEINILHNVKGG